VRPRRDDDVVYMFQHVPKCAGRTIEHRLEESLPTSRSATLNFKAKTKVEVRDRLLREHKRPRRLRTIIGHRVYYGLHEVTGREGRYFTFLRHPVDLVGSLYNHFASRPERRDLMAPDGQLVDFAQFVEHPLMRNVIVRQLSNAMEGERCPGMAFPGTMDEAVAAGRRFIDSCWFVGFVERFDEDARHIAAALGVPPEFPAQNVSTRYATPATVAACSERILELNASDLTLYEYAWERFG
jgi:hypothetical protein